MAYTARCSLQHYTIIMIVQEIFYIVTNIITPREQSLLYSCKHPLYFVQVAWIAHTRLLYSFEISKMAAGRNPGLDRTGNSAIRSADPENPTLYRTKLEVDWTTGCGDIAS